MGKQKEEALFEVENNKKVGSLVRMLEHMAGDIVRPVDQGLEIAPVFPPHFHSLHR